MESWILVTDRSWYAKVNPKGHFEIEGVPRGVYQVHSWHPILGESSVTIRVPEDIKKMVAIEYRDLPEDFEQISSTMVTTEGEVGTTRTIWHEVDDW